MARRATKLDVDIQQLYGLPLAEFTQARNGLARRLKKEGKADAADEVASLPKPTVSAWAVSHLFRAEGDQMADLLEAGERSRAALREILSGGDPGALRDAIQEARDLISELRERAADALAEGGRRPGQAIVDRIGTNLQSLAFSPAATEVADRGWLDVDLPPPGFEVLAGLQLAAMPHRAPAPAPRAHPPKPPTPIEEHRARRAPEKEETATRKRETSKQAEARERERKRREEEREKERREQEERQAQRLRDRISRAESDFQEATGRADFLRRKADQAEEAAAEARRRADEAEEAADEARKRANEAGRAVSRARKALDVARKTS
jgi:hypothetical protein